MTITATQYSAARHDRANPSASQAPRLPTALKPVYQRLVIHLQWVQRFRGPAAGWRARQYAQQVTTLLTEPLSAPQQAHTLQVATQSWYDWMQSQSPAGSVLVNACVLLAAALCRQLRQTQPTQHPTQATAPVDKRPSGTVAQESDATHARDSAPWHDFATAAAPFSPVINPPGGQ